MILKGNIFKYGDNINTDLIIPGRYGNIICNDELAKHCLEDLDSSFVEKVKLGDILVVGNNFGCGSSREVAPIVIQKCGISCIIGKSFARIFFRNAINIGLRIIQSPDFFDDVEDGESTEIEIENDVFVNTVTQNKFQIDATYPLLNEIITAGGLINYLNNQ